VAQAHPDLPLQADPPPPIDVEPPLSIRAEGWWAEHDVLPRTIYWGIHLACGLAFVLGVTTGDFLLFLATYTLRMFGITGGYHRYFAHKAYKTSRGFQFVLALLGCSATQKGPLWWAGHHRGHHKYADQPGKDVHSPADGLWHAHQGWIFDGRWDDTPVEQIEDFAKYPELVWLNRYYPVPPAALAVLCFAFGGLSGLLWGFAISTVALWHSTYAINSICHILGSRPYDTKDTSRNNPLMALLTLGEGWHNNHHHYCASARQGFRWWEIDVTYYALRALGAVGLIWDIREPPAHIINSGKRRAPETLRKAA
jgi:stearoyl-CoA desaturase (delta-9 desaturase)